MATAGWELALVGKNLTKSYYFIRSAEAASTGTAAGFATGIGADIVGSVSRGRQIMVRGTFKFGQGD